MADPRGPTASECPKWKVMTIFTGKPEGPNEAYASWDRHCKARFSTALRRGADRGDREPGHQARGPAATLRQSRAVPDRHGSLRRCPALGARTRQARGSRPTD